MKKGLTTFELLLSIAVIAIILSISIPFYFSFFVKSKSESMTQEILSSVHRAKIKAMASENDDSWGLAINKDSNITIFRGTNYATRNQLYDETIKIEDGFTFNAETEIIFSKMNGFLETAKIISFADTNGDTKTINIDRYGNATF